MHRGARPDSRPLPENLIQLGRSTGFPANGAVSNLGISSQAVGTLGRELRHGGYDVIHVHEPNVPFVSFFATEFYGCRWWAPSTATPPARWPTASPPMWSGVRRLYNKLGVRIAVSEAAQWTAERYYGGRYRVVPNGVDLAAAQPEHGRPGESPLELLFVGRADARKGLPVLLRAFEALRSAGVPARLTVAGATPEEVEPVLIDAEGVHVAGRVSEEEKWRLLARPTCCARRRWAGELRHGAHRGVRRAHPVVASDIAGYRDVVRHGVDGLLVPPADRPRSARRCATLASIPSAAHRMAAAARERAERFAWPRVAAEVVEAYEDAVRCRQPATAAGRGAAGRPGRRRRPAPRRPRRTRPRSSRRCPPSAPARRSPGPPRAVIGAGAGGVGLAALALDRIGIESIGRARLAATPIWVLVAFALMCASMLCAPRPGTRSCAPRCPACACAAATPRAAR